MHTHTYINHRWRWSLTADLFTVQSMWGRSLLRLARPRFGPGQWYSVARITTNNGRCLQGLQHLVQYFVQPPDQHVAIICRNVCSNVFFLLGQTHMSGIVHVDVTWWFQLEKVCFCLFLRIISNATMLCLDCRRVPIVPTFRTFSREGLSYIWHLVFGNPVAPLILANALEVKHHFRCKLVGHFAQLRRCRLPEIQTGLWLGTECCRPGTSSLNQASHRIP